MIKEEPDLVRSFSQRINPNTQKERVHYLWSKLRIFAKVIGKLILINKEIKTFGTTKNNKQKKLDYSKVSDSRLFLFYPKSRFKICWNSLIVLFLFYTGTVLPYRICFNVLQDNNMLYFDLTMDFVFFVDILINFNTAITSSTEKLIISRKVIMKEYLKSWFFIDLLSCVPLELIDDSSNSKNNRFFKVLRVSRIYRLIRLLRLLKLMRVFRSQYIHNFLNKAKFNTAYPRLFVFTLYLVIFIHIIGCLWYYLPQLEDNQALTWKFVYDINDLTNYESYIASIYYVFTTLTTVGYGDIVPISNIEKIFAMVLMGFGVGFYSYMIGSLTTSLKSSDKLTARLKQKYEAFKEFASYIKLPKTLINKVKKSLRTNIQNNFYEQLDFNQLVQELPSNLREEIFENANSTIISGIDFFIGKPKSFVNSIVPKLKFNSFLFKETLYEENEVSDEVYFIKLGKVHLKMNGKIVFRVYLKGSYFGEVEVLENINRESSATIGSQAAEVYILSKTDFFEVLKEYPDIMKTIKDIAMIRKIKHSESKNLAINNMKEFQNSDSFIDDSISAESLNNYEVLNRNDTAVMISVQRDNPEKRFNRKIWSNAMKKKTKNDKILRTKSKTEAFGQKKSLNSTKISENPKKSLNFKIKTDLPITKKAKRLNLNISSLESFDKNEETSIKNDFKDPILIKIPKTSTIYDSVLIDQKYKEKSIEDKVINIQLEFTCSLIHNALDSQKSLSSLLLKLQLSYNKKKND